LRLERPAPESPAGPESGDEHRMSDPKVQGQEPTMEEILASIRRIISEGEDPNAAPTASAKPAAAPRPAPGADGVLELTDMVGADGKVVNIAAVKASAATPAIEEFPNMAEPQPAALETPEMPADDVVLTSAEPTPTPPPSRMLDDEALIGAATAAASSAAFAALSKTMHRDSAPLPTSVPIGSGRTLEELVAEMIRPMLRDWLDSNLPGLIERLVQREIERIVRRADD
jgi:cell pole-organizing protein PopZ